MQITDFYDYSMENQYNMAPIDEYNFNFIDNIHPSNVYNNIIVNDLLTEEKLLSTHVTKENIEEVLTRDTKNLENYIKENPILVDAIKNIKIEDSTIAIKRKS